MTKHILGVDPGDTSGIVVMEYDGTLLDMDNVIEKDINDYLLEKSDKYNFDMVVAEDYRVYGHKAKAHSGSRVPAIKILGAVTIWAKMNKARVILQPASILPIARKWSKAKGVGAHKDSHWVDAYNHVFYWLVRNGRVKPKGRQNDGNK